jgi:hypothetical protein
MNPLVRSLFHELSDLPQSEREVLFDRKAIAQEVRAEVESLLRFAPGKDWDNSHWGPLPGHPCSRHWRNEYRLSG